MEYIVPQKLPEALRLLQEWQGQARLIAGGTNVIPDLRAGNLKARVLIDLGALSDLSFIREDKGWIRLGGLTLVAQLAASRLLGKAAPPLSAAAGQFANPLVRNRATLAGNLADASPAADLAVPLIALEATVVAASQGGERQIPMDRFFLGPHRSVLRRDELLREVYFPKTRPGAKMDYFKLGLRNAMAVSVVSAALLLELERGRCRKVRIGLGAVAPRPIRARTVEELLEGREITASLIGQCREKVGEEISPISDIRATAEYRKAMAGVLVGRLLQRQSGGEQ